MFHDRFDAGELLAQNLSQYRKSDALILAIPRGALQIGQILHERLDLPLDIIVTKKIPHPHNPEFAIGAVDATGNCSIDPDFAKSISFAYLEEQKKKLSLFIKDRYAKYRGSRKFPSLSGKTLILVDDGIATGNTIFAAIGTLRQQHPKKIIVAVPVCSDTALVKLKTLADEVVCLLVPENLSAIGQFYERFEQVEDEEAISILKNCMKKG
ncbi:phosphoribosyltransferase [Candidatus Micrarchaeota archaeon]|nr:phosphoribosyltransferase [Candidatus Micrarchaeota archaeon]